MKTRLFTALVACIAISACSSEGLEVASNNSGDQEPPFVIGEVADPQMPSETDSESEEGTTESEETPTPVEVPVSEEEEPVAEQPAQQEPEPAPEPVTETPVAEPAPEATPDPVIADEINLPPQDAPLTPEEDESLAPEEEDEANSLVGYFKMTDVYNGGTVRELPRHRYSDIETTTFMIVSARNDDGTTTTGLLDITMSEDGIFYAKPPTAEVFAEYGVLDREGELCRVSSANIDDFRKHINSFIGTPLVDPESLPTCRELDTADPYPGYFVVELSMFNASDCDLTTPRFDISVGAEVEWPLCKLFYRRVIGDNVVGYYEMSFTFDRSIALIPLEHMGDIFTVEQDVIGVLLKNNASESQDNLCMVGDITELGSNIDYFGYIPSQSCTESQPIVIAMAM